MKLSLKQLQDSFAALQQLSENKFPAKLAYRLGRVLRSAQSELEHLRAAHLALVQKLGEQVEGTENWRVMPENATQFQEEITELLAEQVDVWGDPLDVTLLGDIEIAPETLAPLDWLIQDGIEIPAPAQKAQGAAGD